ncbi:MAG: isoleucine--tRNA ligase [Clostridia bacterium]
MKKVKSGQDFVEMEQEVLKFWEEENCFEKLQEKNKGNEPFRFLDGPITANNPMGIHHAWGRTLKDTYIRYKAMNGFSCHYRNGFDAQGLWLEVEVEKELGFKDKKDVEAYGLDKFTLKCMDRVRKFSGVITDQSKRLGQWMDWENSYFTNTEENITSIWYFLNKCHEKGLIKQGFKPMPWCPRCGTSLSEHEMSGSYKNLEHTAVFFKLPLKNRNEKILVWTTTPWTLSSNVALAVNEEIDYARVKIASDNEPIILCKDAIKVLGEDKLEVLDIFKGSELVGLEYETCFKDLDAQKDIVHKVVAWEDVDSVEGSGVVHIAPGCGVEDYELGKRLSLPMIVPVDDLGNFLEGFDFLTGKNTRDVKEEIFDRLDKQNKLYKVHQFTHSYPVCWRCKTEVIYKAVKEWYIDTEALRPKLIEAANTVKWEPEHIGKRMNDWLTNMGNWAISRKRFYGLPLPFYPCDKCGKLTVVSSKKDLIEKAVDKAKAESIPDLHRPWIDDIQIKCTCGNHITRISDVGDCWLDAGIVPFSTLGYFTDKEKWNKYFPAEWVTEMKEQVRLWFYSLLFMSVVLEEKAPYEKVLSYGSVIAEDGTKFSKTGFMIKFDEAANKIGADAARYLYAGANTNNDVRFGFNLGEEARRKMLGFFNIYMFFDTYASIDNPDIKSIILDESKMQLSDKWLMNKLNKFVKEARESMDAYEVQNLIKKFETFSDDISNFYIRINRKRFWISGESETKNIAYACLYKAIKEIVKVMAPVIPFLTEYLWNDLVKKYEKDECVSVHLTDYPKNVEDKFIDNKILEDVDLIRNIISLGLLLRNEKQIKVRQPLQTLYIGINENRKDAVLAFEKVIKDELNIKDIQIVEDETKLNVAYLGVNFKTAGAALKGDVQKLKQILECATDEEMSKYVSMFENGKVETILGNLDANIFVKLFKCKSNIISAHENEITVAMDINLTHELIIEGAYRDLVRAIQVFRKDQGLMVSQKITLGISTDSDMYKEVLETYSNKIKSETLTTEIVNEVLANKNTLDLEGEVVTISI